MRGPDHYRAAERLIADAESAIEVDSTNILLAAQVHATLAVAAACALAQDIGAWETWRRVIL